MEFSFFLRYQAEVRSLSTENGSLSGFGEAVGSLSEFGDSKWSCFTASTPGIYNAADSGGRIPRYPSQDHRPLANGSGKRQWQSGSALIDDCLAIGMVARRRA